MELAASWTHGCHQNYEGTLGALKSEYFAAKILSSSP